MPTQAELESLTGEYPILRRMIRHGVPLTRDNYIALNWGPDLPKDWNGEHEHDIPPFLRDPEYIADEA